MHLNDGTTTQANESALAVALIKYAAHHKKDDASNLCVLGFDYGYYGNSFLTKSISDPRIDLQ